MLEFIAGFASGMVPVVAIAILRRRRREAQVARFVGPSAQEAVEVARACEDHGRDTWNLTDGGIAASISSLGVTVTWRPWKKSGRLFQEHYDRRLSLLSTEMEDL